MRIRTVSGVWRAADYPGAKGLFFGFNVSLLFVIILERWIKAHNWGQVRRG
jgi:hypothetical protein